MTPRYAGVVSRAIARAIDLVLLAVLIAGSAWLAQQFLGVDPEHCPEVRAWWHLRARLCRLLPYVVPVAAAIIPPLYRVIFYGVTGRTPGMSVLGLRLLRADGRPVRFRQALKRVGAFYLTLGLGSVLIPVTERRRALHDIVAGTVVVYDWGSHASDVERAIALARSADD